MSIICLLYSVYLTITMFLYEYFAYGWTITGHNYIEVDGELVCKRCGKVSK